MTTIAGGGGGRRRYDPAVDRWHPLGTDAAGAVIVGAGVRSWLSGGVAIDHWLGRRTRPHGDVDVSVLRGDWPAFATALPAGIEPWWAIDGVLDRVDAPLDVRSDNVWCRDATGSWVLQVNLEDGDGAVWRYRRDGRVTLPWADAVQDVRGVPTVAPEVQLLWKSARPEVQDEADLAVVLPLLTRETVGWLAAAITIAHPGSPWIGRLG